jgi:hypothetical protein
MGQIGKLTVTRAQPSSRHWALTGIILFSLVVTLATRTFPSSDRPTTTVQCHATRTMRQHLARDAAEWAPAVLILTTLQAPAFYRRVVPVGPPLPRLFSEQNLYTRPPPSC